jgi:hypothetical protein
MSGLQILSLRLVTLRTIVFMSPDGGHLAIHTRAEDCAGVFTSGVPDQTPALGTRQCVRFGGAVRGRSQAPVSV